MLGVESSVSETERWIVFVETWLGFVETSMSGVESPMSEVEWAVAGWELWSKNIEG